MKRQDDVLDRVSAGRRGGFSQDASYEKAQESIDKDRVPPGLSNTTLPAFEDIAP